MEKVLFFHIFVNLLTPCIFAINLQLMTPMPVSGSFSFKKKIYLLNMLMNKYVLLFPAPQSHFMISSLCLTFLFKFPFGQVPGQLTSCVHVFAATRSINTQKRMRPISSHLDLILAQVCTALHFILLLKS